MVNDALKDAPYTDRFKARIGNATDDGTKPAAPEGDGDTWISGNTLSIGSSGSWVDYRISFDKVNATADPTTDDDDTDGYSVGSLWVNVTLDKTFVCVDASTSAAVWNQIDGVPSVGSDDVTNDSTVTGATVTDALETLNAASGGGSGPVPIVILTKTSTQTVTASTNTYVSWDNEIVDTEDAVDLGTADDEIVIQSTATYQVEMRIRIANNSGALGSDVFYHAFNVHIDTVNVDRMADEEDMTANQSQNPGRMISMKSVPMDLTATEVLQINHYGTYFVGSGNSPTLGSSTTSYKSYLILWKLP